MVTFLYLILYAFIITSSLHSYILLKGDIFHLAYILLQLLPPFHSSFNFLQPLYITNWRESISHLCSYFIINIFYFIISLMILELIEDLPTFLIYQIFFSIGTKIYCTCQLFSFIIF